MEREGRRGEEGGQALRRERVKELENENGERESVPLRAVCYLGDRRGSHARPVRPPSLHPEQREKTEKRTR